MFRQRMASHDDWDRVPQPRFLARLPLLNDFKSIIIHRRANCLFICENCT
jgi:hypothetical protein